MASFALLAKKHKILLPTLGSNQPQYDGKAQNVAENCFCHWSEAAEMYFPGGIIYEEAFLPDTLVIYRDVFMWLLWLSTDKESAWKFICNIEFKKCWIFNVFATSTTLMWIIESEHAKDLLFCSVRENGCIMLFLWTCEQRHLVAVSCTIQKVQNKSRRCKISFKIQKRRMNALCSFCERESNVI